MTTGTPVRPLGIGLTRDYERLPAVEAEIGALPPQDHAGFRAAVERTQSAEAVLYAIRQLVRAGRQEEARSMGNLLATRAESVMEKAARARFPTSPDLRQELLDSLGIQVVRKMIDTSPAAEFWEVHFENSIIKQSLTIMDALLKQQKREIQTVSLDFERDDGSRAVEEPAAPGDLTEDLIGVLEDDAAMREVLALLSREAQMALRLKLEGFPDKSNDPSQPSISGIMGKSDRMLRHYWGQAREVLGPWLRARGHSLPGDEPR